MKGRIYLRDFSYESTPEDLSQFISKICPVEEVYITGKTPTGIDRSFAIVVVNASNDLVDKCVKLLHNCLWRGTRIQVEKAKEYYKDRFERERALERKQNARLLSKFDDHTDTEESDQSIVVPDVERLELESSAISTGDIMDSTTETNTAIPKLSNDDVARDNKAIIDSMKRNKLGVKAGIVRIKKSRDGPPMIISTVPTSSLIQKKSKKFLCCGRKTMFDYDDSGVIIYTPLQISEAETSGDSESEEEEELVIVKKSIDKSSKDVVKHNKDAKALLSSSDNTDGKEVAQPQGGGSRKGFGGISTVAITALPVPLKEAYLKNKFPTTVAKGGVQVDCCIETEDEQISIFGLDADDLRNDKNQELIEFAGDDDNRNPYRVDDIPCVDELELTEEALSAERMRSLKMLELIMSKDINIEKNEKINEKKSVISIPNKKHSEIKNENKISSNDRIDTIKNWESIKTKRFDPTDLKQSYALTAEEVEMKNKLINDKILKKIQKDQQNEKILEDMKLKDENANENENENEKMKDNFVDLNTFKNIFYKEGGIWFGDDGTLNDAVIKGNTGADPLFKEAEKYGIDIRTSQNDTKIDDKSAVNNKMTFGFFDNFDSESNEGTNNIQNIQHIKNNNSDELNNLGDDDTHSVSSPLNGIKSVHTDIDKSVHTDINKSVHTDTQLTSVHENEKNKSKILKIPLFSEEVIGIASPPPHR